MDAAGPDSVGTPSQPIAPHSDLARAVGNRVRINPLCIGCRLCCWCSMGLSQYERCNLLAASVLVERAGDRARIRDSVEDVPFDRTNVTGLRYLLAGCVQQMLALGSDPGLENDIANMLAKGLLPDDAAPRTSHHRSHSSSRAYANGSAQAPPSKRQKVNNDHSMPWDEEATAEWRQEPRLEHSRHRKRRVKVFLGRSQSWGDLGRQATEEVLAFYDHATIFDMLPDVPVTMEGVTYYMEYRYEGGIWLTQRNNERAGNPRACQVYYTETE